MKAKGCMGTILRVDLDSGRIWTQDLADAVAREFMGGSGFGTKMLFEETTPETYPLGRDNPRILTVGPLTGTTLFNSDRFDVVSLSPPAGRFGESGADGIPEVAKLSEPGLACCAQ